LFRNPEEGQGSKRAAVPMMMMIIIIVVVCPLCSYVYLYCAVSVIGLVAIDSAHK
jgi:hypothetical protein